MDKVYIMDKVSQFDYTSYKTVGLNNINMTETIIVI